MNACASTQYSGVVAACGLAQGMDLPGTVAPFILRGVTLLGIDSVMRPIADRIQAWDRLADLVEPEWFDSISEPISLDEVIPTAQRLIAGQVRGRVVVAL